MELYIIRHGDPDYENDALTERGWKEARALGETMAKIAPDKIYTSPMGRAKQTAEPTLKALNMTSSVEEWTAEHWFYMQFPDYDKDKSGFKFDLQNGVTDFYDYSTIGREEVLSNLVKGSDEFLARHGYVRKGIVYEPVAPTNEKIAVFCHAGFGSAWIAHLLGMPPEYGYLRFNLFTTSVTKFVFYQEGISPYVRAICESLNDVTHKSGIVD